MSTSAAGARGERRAEDVADFLRRLSIADAKVLLERTRKEKENKTKEMQKMIGVRYRDLIESADKIVNMHSAALRLEVSLKEMPEVWKQMELALTTALSVEDDPSKSSEEVTGASDGYEQAIPDLETSADKVAFLVNVPEKMWQLLDEGESLQALQLYQHAEEIHGECLKQPVEQEFPFLAAQWTCIQSFRPRMTTCAKNYLTCRGKESRFYAENLCTLAVLSDPPMKADKLFETFLNARSKWMTGIRKMNREEHPSQPCYRKERVLMVILKTISMTMTQTEIIFGGGDGCSMLSSIPQLSQTFKDGLGAFVLSGNLLDILSKWFLREQRQIAEVASPIISSIDTISLLSQVQSKLNAASQASGGCRDVKLWSRILSKTHLALPGRHDKQTHGSVESVFSVLFAEAFRMRTRDLVQNSFVEALEAIKSQIRATLEDTIAANLQSDHRLKNVKFYDYFETIQKRAADLDASDLQSVLIEEFLRTLFKLVMFFEETYPLPGEQKDGKESGCMNEGIQLPSLFLNISNIFAGIVTGFSRQIDKMFPGSTSTVSIPEKDPALLLVGPAYTKYSFNGFVSKVELRAALEDILEGEENAVFIDEELKRVDALGFYSLYLVAEIKRKASYPQLFVNVLHGLSKRYCEAWATILLNQKIAPLRELLQMEQYNSTNEEWIATHEGWIEQVISDEGLGGDTDDSSSESELALGDEKIWLPWCETPTVSSFLFSCCYSLDDANWMIQSSIGAKEEQIKLMHHTIREVLVEQLTIASVALYDAAVSLIVEAKATQKDSVLNFGFSDFIRFGWGDELNPDEGSPGLLKLKSLFERMHEFIDPVDWEIYGPQLIENVVLQFRKSRLLFSSLSESNDINKINGKEIVISAQDTRPLARIAEPVARFSLLPVPSHRRRFQRTLSSMSRTSDDDTMDGRSRANSSTLFHERATSDDASGSQSSLKLQNLLTSSTSSNIFNAAASGTNLLSSAAKGIGFLSSATSSYLREGEAMSSNKYF